MPAHVKRHGHYKLLRTNHGHRILDLEDDSYYAWVEGQQGEILVRSDDDHEFVDTLQEGDFRYVEFEDDPEYKDMPHLFLEEKGGRYREVVLPNGLPTNRDYQKKVVRTDNTLRMHDLEDYLEHPAPAGGGENRLERKGGENDPDLPIDDYAARTVDEVKEAAKDLDRGELERLREHEAFHKDRKTAKQAIDRELEHRHQD